jgi:hypothetical protein
MTLSISDSTPCSLTIEYDGRAAKFHADASVTGQNPIGLSIGHPNTPGWTGLRCRPKSSTKCFDSWSAPAPTGVGR